MMGALCRPLSGWLLASAAGRMRGHGADWADAMVAEAETCTSDADRLAWAWGCWVASVRAAISTGGIVYAAALAAGLGVMTAYEWSADESSATIVVLGLIALGLGTLRPKQALLSGTLVGLVVAGVIAFEAVSGIRPGYEARAQTLAHSLHWLILLVPAVLLAAVGGHIGRRLRPAGSPR